MHEEECQYIQYMLPIVQSSAAHSLQLSPAEAQAQHSMSSPGGLGEHDGEDSKTTEHPTSASEPPDIPLLYKKNINKKTPLTSNDNGDIPSSPSPSSHDILQSHKPSRRGQNSRPGIKTALPATEVKSSLLTHNNSSIISPAEFLILVGWMPKYQRLNEFHLSYVLQKDGASLDTIYSLCSDPDISASFIIIEAECGHVFGGFINEPFKKSSTYYGSGESFVFSIRPELAVYRWKQSDLSHEHGGNNNSEGKIDHHRDSNTKANLNLDLGMFVLSDSKQLLMGGGGGYAFRLDDELHAGYSQPCDTYHNKLLSQSEFFTCVNVEVWTTKPAPVIIPLPPNFDPTVAVPKEEKDEVILLTKKKSSAAKARPTNPPSLSFVTKAPVKKGTNNALNEWKSDAATIVQSAWRRAVCSRHFAKLRRCALSIQQVWRNYKNKRRDRGAISTCPPAPRSSSSDCSSDDAAAARRETTVELVTKNEEDSQPLQQNQRQDHVPESMMHQEQLQKKQDRREILMKQIETHKITINDPTCDQSHLNSSMTAANTTAFTPAVTLVPPLPKTFSKILPVHEINVNNSTSRAQHTSSQQQEGKDQTQTQTKQHLKSGALQSGTAVAATETRVPTSVPGIGAPFVSLTLVLVACAVAAIAYFVMQ